MKKEIKNNIKRYKINEGEKFLYKNEVYTCAKDVFLPNWKTGIFYYEYKNDNRYIYRLSASASEIDIINEKDNPEYFI